MTPSRRLRILTFGMRWLVKPKLRRTATPEKAFRNFERSAPLLFSTPRGTDAVTDTHWDLVSCGPAHPERIILYLHGGAFVAGSRRSYRAMAARLAKRTGCAVALPDYPLLQDRPFPAAPAACRAAWDALRKKGWDADQIALAGDSAGGALVFALLAEVLADGQRPAAALAFSPWTDLTLSGESLRTNVDADPLLPVSRMQEVVEMYLDGADPADPRASPLFADFPNPPPVLIQVGEDEVLRSDAERIAAKTGATLELWPHVPHVWQMFDGRLDEAKQAMRQAASFLQTSFESASR